MLTTTIPNRFEYFLFCGISSSSVDARCFSCCHPICILTIGSSTREYMHSPFICRILLQSIRFRAVARAIQIGRNWRHLSQCTNKGRKAFSPSTRVRTAGVCPSWQCFGLLFMLDFVMFTLLQFFSLLLEH